MYTHKTEKINSIKSDDRLIAFGRWITDEHDQFINDVFQLRYRQGNKAAYEYFVANCPTEQKNGFLKDDTLAMIFRQNYNMHGKQYTINRFYKTLFVTGIPNHPGESFNDIRHNPKYKNLDEFYKEN